MAGSLSCLSQAPLATPLQSAPSLALLAILVVVLLLRLERRLVVNELP